MVLTDAQANSIFDILVETGNHPDQKNRAGQSYDRAEFLSKMERNTSEYWYSSTNGSSMKIYFQFGSNQPLYVYAQTTAGKDKGMPKNLQDALDAYVATQ